MCGKQKFYFILLLSTTSKQNRSHKIKLPSELKTDHIFRNHLQSTCLAKMNSKFISWLLVTCSWQVISEQIKFKKRFLFSRWRWEVMNLITSFLIHSNALVAIMMIYQKNLFSEHLATYIYLKIYLHARCWLKKIHTK